MRRAGCAASRRTCGSATCSSCSSSASPPLNFGTWRRTACAAAMRARYARRLWMFAAPALLAPAVVFVLGPHTIFANNAAEFAVGFGELARPGCCERRHQLAHPLRDWARRSRCCRCSRANVRGAAVRIRPVALGPGKFVECRLRRAGRAASSIWRSTRGAAPYETGGVGGRAAARSSCSFDPSAVSRRSPRWCSSPCRLQAARSQAARVRAAERVRWIEPPAAIYQFSSAQNVIHIVLDEFQSDVFHEILHAGSRGARPPVQRVPVFRRSRRLHFRRRRSACRRCWRARSTGTRSRRRSSCARRSSRSSIFEKVARAGYDVDATTIVPIDSFEQWMGPEAAPNWKGARFRIRKPFVSREDYREVSARQLLELSLFRHVPHTAKGVQRRAP